MGHSFKKGKKIWVNWTSHFSRFEFLNFTFLLKCKFQVNKKWHFSSIKFTFLGGWRFLLAFFLLWFCEFISKGIQRKC